MQVCVGVCRYAHVRERARVYVDEAEMCAGEAEMCMCEAEVCVCECVSPYTHIHTKKHTHKHEMNQKLKLTTLLAGS